MRGRRCNHCYRRRSGHRDRGTSETHNVPPQLDTLDRVLDLRGCAPADGFAAPFYPWRLRRAPLVACQQNYNRFRGQASARLAAGIGTFRTSRDIRVEFRNWRQSGLAWRVMRVRPAGYLKALRSRLVAWAALARAKISSLICDVVLWRKPELRVHTAAVACSGIGGPKALPNSRRPACRSVLHRPAQGLHAIRRHV